MTSIPIQNRDQETINLWQIPQQWLENWQIEKERTARRIVKLIPAQCPFAREIRLFNRVMFRIPPLCKLNPCYEQLVSLRFRALCFLAETCGHSFPALKRRGFL